MSKEYIIEVDEIRTGKVGIFTFYRKGRILDEGMFRVKEKNQYYNYRHHIDAENFDRWCEISKERIFQFDEKVFIATEWENLMKYEIYNLISNGALNRTVIKDNISYDIKVVWKGSELVQPDLLTIYRK